MGKEIFKMKTKKQSNITQFNVYPSHFNEDPKTSK